MHLLKYGGMVSYNWLFKRVLNKHVIAIFTKVGAPVAISPLNYPTSTRKSTCMEDKNGHTNEDYLNSKRNSKKIEIKPIKSQRSQNIIISTDALINSMTCLLL